MYLHYTAIKTRKRFLQMILNTVPYSKYNNILLTSAYRFHIHTTDMESNKEMCSSNWIASSNICTIMPAHEFYTN